MYSFFSLGYQQLWIDEHLVVHNGRVKQGLNSFNMLF